MTTCLKCGALLTLEMEKDDSICVDCAAEAAGFPNGISADPEPITLTKPEPFQMEEILRVHFPRHDHRRTA